MIQNSGIYEKNNSLYYKSAIFFTIFIECDINDSFSSFFSYKVIFFIKCMSYKISSTLEYPRVVNISIYTKNL